MSVSNTHPPSAKWKGKARAFEPGQLQARERERERAREKERDEERQIRRRDAIEGSGNADGIVLPLDMVGSGVYDVAYTLPVKFGASSSQQQFSLQIDTGSSDLWVASTSCSTSSCKLTDGRLYDPSGARATGQDFSIPYLQGSASGPIVWERVVVGGYEIDNQALAAANDVQSEPLTSKFSGILGLALPLNSIIAQDIPPVTSNAPDGAAWASNLFSITPTSQSPAARFLSLSLARPDSDRIPSLLGIGRHPSALVPDPSKVDYEPLVSDSAGTLFWKVQVRGITVYVNGERREVDVGRSNTGAVFPSAVVDSGVPLILTTSAVANAIYGAVGVEPASDGKYYIPCTTPLNLTLSIDSRPEIPIHPLDLTALPPDSSSSSGTCIGLIQTADAQLAQHDGSIGDMVLGVPFLRNVYSVMAYVAPRSDGSFPALTTSSDDDGDGGTVIASAQAQTIKPRFGLLALTDPTIALQEFHTVRVLNQPLPPSSSSPSASSNGASSSGNTPNTGSDNNTKTVDLGHKLSTGVIVALALVGVVALVVEEREGGGKGGHGGMGGWEALSMDQKDAYALVRGRGMGGVFIPKADAEGGFKEGEGKSLSSNAGSGDADKGAGEFGERRVWEGEEGDDTLVAGTISRDKYAGEPLSAAADAPLFPVPMPMPMPMPALNPVPGAGDAGARHLHQYTDSDSDVGGGGGIGGGGGGEHRQMASVDVPLLGFSGAGYTLDDPRAREERESTLRRLSSSTYSTSDDDQGLESDPGPGPAATSNSSMGRVESASGSMRSGTKVNYSMPRRAQVVQEDGGVTEGSS